MSRPALIVTCDEPPCLPLGGNNKKTYDLLGVLRGDHDIDLIVYPRDAAEARRLRDCWQSPSFRLHFLSRRWRGRHLRSVAQRLSLPTVTRDFRRERDLVRSVLAERPEARLLIDLISGSPLCLGIAGGVVISGHDCMSQFWRSMAAWSSTTGARWHARVRSYFAMQAERRYYHLAHRVHVVSSQDARDILQVNSAARCAVIPLGGRLADPAKMQEGGLRRAGLIWGNLGFGPILAGVRRLFRALEEQGIRLPGWTILGGVAEEEARERLPQMASIGIEYMRRVDDLEGHLGGTRLLVLPDLAGAGQKNRCLDGLAHGCCVVGLDEVFRDLPGESGREFLRFHSPEEIAGALPVLLAAETSGIGEAGRQMFLQHFSLECLGRRWRTLLGSLPLLELRESRDTVNGAKANRGNG